MAASSSEEDLLFRFRASYQKQDGTVEIRARGVTWKNGTATVEVPFAVLAKHEVSPKSHPKAMLKLSRTTGGPPVVLTIREATAERAYSVLSDAKVTISAIVKRRKRSEPSESGSSSSHKARKRARAVPEEAGNVEEELRRSLLAADARLSAAYKELVTEGVVSEEEFWSARRSESIEAVAPAAPSNELLADAPPAVGEGSKLRYTLNAAKIAYILEMYPAVRRAREAHVPPMSEKAFWVKYFQSRYYLRDKGAAVAAGKAGELGEGGDDLFARFERRGDDALDPRRPVAPGVDLTKTAADRALDEPPDEPDENEPAGALDPSAERVVHKFNRHADRVVGRIALDDATPPVVAAADLVDDLDTKPPDRLLTLNVDDRRLDAAPTGRPAGLSLATPGDRPRWSPASLALSPALETARRRAAAAFRVLDDKARRPGAAPDEPFRSSAEEHFALALQLLKAWFTFPSKRPKLRPRLDALNTQLDSLRRDLRDSSTRHAAQHAAVLQPILAQIAAILEKRDSDHFDTSLFAHV